MGGAEEGDEDVVMGESDEEEEEEEATLGDEKDDEESSDDDSEREELGEYSQWAERADAWYSGSLRLAYPAAGRSNGGILQLWLGRAGSACYDVSTE